MFLIVMLPCVVAGRKACVNCSCETLTVRLARSRLPLIRYLQAGARPQVMKDGVGDRMKWY